MFKFRITNISSQAVYLTEAGAVLKSGDKGYQVDAGTLLKPGEIGYANRLDKAARSLADIKIEEGSFSKAETSTLGHSSNPQPGEAGYDPNRHGGQSGDPGYDPNRQSGQSGSPGHDRNAQGGQSGDPDYDPNRQGSQSGGQGHDKNAQGRQGGRGNQPGDPGYDKNSQGGQGGQSGRGGQGGQSGRGGQGGQGGQGGRGGKRSAGAPSDPGFNQDGTPRQPGQAGQAYDQDGTLRRDDDQDGRQQSDGPVYGPGGMPGGQRDRRDDRRSMPGAPGAPGLPGTTPLRTYKYKVTNTSDTRAGGGQPLFLTEKGRLLKPGAPGFLTDPGTLLKAGESGYAEQIDQATHDVDGIEVEEGDYEMPGQGGDMSRPGDPNYSQRVDVRGVIPDRTYKFRVTNISGNRPGGGRTVYITECGEMIKPGMTGFANRLDQSTHDMPELSIEEGEFHKPPGF